MKNLYLFILFISTLGVSCKKDVNEPIRSGNLEGVILNSHGQTIEGALIAVQKHETISNSNGKYYLKDIPAGEHQVIVSKEFYLTKVQSVIIIEEETSSLDFTLMVGISYLKISDSIEIVSPNAGSYEILVESNAGWSVRSSSLSVICSVSSGEGNDKVKLSWTANNGLSDLSDSIAFVSGNIIKCFVLKRVAPIILLELEGIPGNKVIGISDSVYVLFNKPIMVSSIMSNNTYCSSEIHYKQVNNGCGIMFTYDCAKVGASFPFTIAISDLNGFASTKSFEVPFFKSRLHFEGYLSNYQLINGEKELLIATSSPSRILRYSIDKDSVTHIYDLSTIIIPYRIAYNPYNHKVYITGADPNNTSKFPPPDLPYFYTLDIRTSEIVKSATIKPRLSYSPDYNDNKPSYFGFTKTGHGIIHFNYHWELIDCTKNDSIDSYPNGNYDFNETILLWNFYPNGDSTKLWITRQDSNCKYIVFDGNNQSFSFVSSPRMTRTAFLTPSRTNDNVFVGQLYAQFIMDSYGNMLGNMSYGGGGDLAGSDFTYRGGNESLIYSMGEDYIDLMDYSKAETLVRFDKQYGLVGLTTTLDGKYIVTIKGGNENSANILVLETKYFYRNNYKHLN